MLMSGAATAELYLAKVIALRWEAENVVSLQLVRDDGGDLPEWEPGAHIDITLPSGLIRQYSLCGDPADRSQYTIAVLREEHGRGGSAEIHDSVMVGQKLWIRGPRNHFPLEPAESYVFIAGGIGVTPIRSMARKAADGLVPWSLHYGGRSLDTMAFTRELTELGAWSGAAVHLVSEADGGLLPLRGILEGVGAGGAVYCCGPTGLLDALRAVATEIGSDVPIHFELFSAPSAGGEEDVDPVRHDHPFRVRRCAVTSVSRSQMERRCCKPSWLPAPTSRIRAKRDFAERASPGVRGCTRPSRHGADRAGTRSERRDAYLCGELRLGRAGTRLVRGDQKMLFCNTVD